MGVLKIVVSLRWAESNGPNSYLVPIDNEVLLRQEKILLGRQLSPNLQYFNTSTAVHASIDLFHPVVQSRGPIDDPSTKGDSQRKPPAMPASASRASAPANSNGHPGAKGEYGHRRTNTDEIDNTISHPGSVKINVEGAFIVDRDSTSPHRTGIDGVNHETTDIRLPNHTAVVSHIAVDVRRYPKLFMAIGF